jgi:Na+-translocating ferredoxin:NAD+ oxidoreductase subunit C
MPRYTFRGGVHPPSRKSETGKSQITAGPAPKMIILPLEHGAGLHYRPVVGIGDSVALGQPVAVTGGPEALVCHSSVSGKIRSISPQPHVSGRSLTSLVIENDGTDRAHRHHPASADTSSLTVEELLQRIREAGVVGLGQGGEAAHIRIAAALTAKPRTVILNGTESEPYLAGEHRLMIERAEEVLEGLRLLMRIFGVKKGKVAVAENDRDAARALRKALGRIKSITLLPVDAKYPMESEKQLVEAVSGRRIPRGKFAWDSGFYVENVAGALALAAAMTRHPVVERVVTVAGDGVRNPRNLNVRIGTAIHELIAFCSGYTSDSVRLIHGGPLAGTSLSSDGMAVTRETRGILAFASKPADRPGPEKPCISCGRCLDCCPMRLYPRKIEYWLLEGDMGRAARSGLEDCDLCGACGYICPSKRGLTGRLAEAKSPGHRGEKAGSGQEAP